MSRPLLRCGLVAALGVMLSACAAQQASHPTAPPEFSPTDQAILLMPLDIQIYELTAGGLEEPRADWTAAARENVAAAINAESAERGVEPIPFAFEDVPADKQDEMHQIMKLHEVVGRAMLQYRYVPGLRLPNKSSEFDWTMGKAVALLRQHSRADYALFVFMKDSHSSDGRVLMNIATAVLFGYAQGGTQMGYATLVDLDTGEVAWFGSLVRESGDLRNPKDAGAAVDDLMSGLPST
ncbi:MAG: hypothetical protein GDA49_12015 [Rhodospirillales bacterium]|nr:hypothetical protein [Rhodospirillales bacterium]